MYEDLKGKVALVTGSGKKSGIGYAMIEKFASCGANVIIADLGASPEGIEVKLGTMDEMQKIADEIEEKYSVQAMVTQLDVLDKDSIAQMIENIKAKFDGVDILCNNAGASFGVPNMMATYDEDAWMKTIDVNLHSVFRVSRAVMPLMFGRTAPTIINTSSRAGKVPSSFNGAYIVAKAGVNMLTKVMATELAQMGIRVNAICPGQIMTDLEKWRFGLEAQALGGTAEDREKEMCTTIPLGRIGTTKEVANLVAFLASSESSYMTGQALNVTGGQLMEL